MQEFEEHNLDLYREYIKVLLPVMKVLEILRRLLESSDLRFLLTGTLESSLDKFESKYMIPEVVRLERTAPRLRPFIGVIQKLHGVCHLLLDLLRNNRNVELVRFISTSRQIEETSRAGLLNGLGNPEYIKNMDVSLTRLYAVTRTTVGAASSLLRSTTAIWSHYTEQLQGTHVRRLEQSLRDLVSFRMKPRFRSPGPPPEPLDMDYEISLINSSIDAELFPPVLVKPLQALRDLLKNTEQAHPCVMRRSAYARQIREQATEARHHLERYAQSKVPETFSVRYCILSRRRPGRAADPRESQKAFREYETHYFSKERSSVHLPPIVPGKPVSVQNLTWSCCS